MPKTNSHLKKPPARVVVSVTDKLLLRRGEAAEFLSISVRAVDYLLANGQLTFRRIGSRTLIPLTELRRFARRDHPQRLAC
jgi:excisionase family DNA binding protein